MVQRDCNSVVIVITSCSHPTSTDHMVHCVEQLVEVRCSGFVKAKFIMACHWDSNMIYKHCYQLHSKINNLVRAYTFQKSIPKFK